MAEKRTSLYEQHVEAGAKLVPFAGWEMPVQYEGVRQEHIAVRTGCGVFDVSHMGEVATEGPQAEDLLQRLLSNDVSKIEAAGAQYSVLCREDGGIIDDLFTYRLAPDRFLTVTNAANHEKDAAWMAEHAGGFDAEAARRGGRVRDARDPGPRRPRDRRRGSSSASFRSRMHTAVLPLRTRSPAAPRRSSAAPATRARTASRSCCRPTAAPELWAALLEAGVTPAGLAARDTLRLEACFHLYGNDMDEDRNPIEAGLGWICKEATGFIGADAVAAAREAGPQQKLVPFALTGPGIPRQGNDVVAGDEVVGTVTSGTLSPCLEQGVGMAYVAAELAEPGTELEIDVRGKRRAARVESRPLYSKERKTEIGGRELPRRPPLPPRARLGQGRRRDRHVRDHLVRAGRPRRGRLLRPARGRRDVKKDGPYAEIESVKAVSDVYAPLSGEIIEVNEALSDTPETLNDDPYSAGWLVKVKLADRAETEQLLSVEATRSCSRTRTRSRAGREPRAGS